MITMLRDRSHQLNFVAVFVAVAVLALAFLLGQRASPLWLGLLVAALGGLVLLSQPALGLLVLVASALVVPLEFNTGTDVKLNPVTLLIPIVAAIWLLDMVRRRRIQVVASPVNLPLLLFLVVGLLSLLIGRVTWDPFVPTSGNFIVAQLAQWAIFAFSALAFWLTANLVKNERWLKRMTWAFLLTAGTLAILRAVPYASGMMGSLATGALSRAPFWMLLVALAGGQLLFNGRLGFGLQLFMLVAVGASLAYAFAEQREAVSTWVGVGAAVATLLWLRFPRLRWPLAALVLILAAIGVLLPAVYDFAGGDDEWNHSGASRLILIDRVIDVTMRNPITGLGPAGYRPYASANPLVIPGNRLWVGAVVSSHNNFVDLFAHAGLAGLAMFGWFVVETARLGARLRKRYHSGFTAGYVNGVLAAGVASLAIMLLADWILPFVYNVGFHGFQASMLVWLFLGGLVSLSAVTQHENG